MYAYLTVKNLSAVSAVTVCADGLPESELLRGEQSRRMTLPCGSCRLQIRDARGRLLFDLWLPLAPFTENIIELHGDFCSLICRECEQPYQK